MLLQSSNIKTETIKISAVILLFTVFLSVCLIYVANYSIKAVSAVHSLDSAELVINRLNARIDLATADYSLLGTSHALEPQSILKGAQELLMLWGFEGDLKTSVNNRHLSNS